MSGWWTSDVTWYVIAPPWLALAAIGRFARPNPEYDLDRPGRRVLIRCGAYAAAIACLGGGIVKTVELRADLGSTAVALAGAAVAGLVVTCVVMVGVFARPRFLVPGHVRR